MKRNLYLLFPLLIGGATAFVRADQTDDAIIAAMKLSNMASYSWSATLNQDSHALQIHGQTSIGGYSLLTFVGFAGGSGSSSSNSGTSGGVNTVFLGDNKSVVESNGNWVTPIALSPASEPTDTGNRTAGGSAGTSGRRAGRNRGTGGGSGGGGPGTSGQRGRSSATTQDAPTGSPRIPTAINLPHEQLAIVAANYTEVHVEDAVVSGKLTDSAAELLLLPPGSNQTPPEKAAGTFRLWTKDGAVTKYELKLTAETGPGGASIRGGLSETVTVELTDIGTTTVDVPPAARHKLGG